MINYRLIDGYENYVLSTNGEIYSKKRKIFMKPRIRKQKRILKDGTIKYSKYKIVGLSKNGKQKTFQIHRLLALHFIENQLNKPCVDHIDGNSLNNNLNNLRWVTHSENNSNIIAKGYCIYKQNRENLNKKYRLEWKLIENGPKKTKGFLTRELAEAWALTQTFPLSKNHNVQF
jgi:hypothetical protein|tara:strand:+ start:740 stop:1261 length:522 start_codon:yes stop_codon:yes gene_type:complete